MAGGSLHELETHLLIAQRLGYLSQAALAPLLAPLLAQSDEVGRLLGRLIRSTR